MELMQDNAQPVTVRSTFSFCPRNPFHNRISQPQYATFIYARKII